MKGPLKVGWGFSFKSPGLDQSLQQGSEACLELEPLLLTSVPAQKMGGRMVA